MCFLVNIVLFGGGFIKQFKNYYIPAIIISFFGELYFYPFEGGFRFSAGVLAYGFILLLFDELHEIKLASLTAVFIFFIRGLINSLNYSIPFLEAMTLDYTGAIYYFIYGIFFYILKVREEKFIPINTILVLFSIDSLSNFIESSIRGDLTAELLTYIILIGITRSTLSYIMYSIFRNQELFIIKKEHKKRYNQLNHIIANIQAEMFYLIKSSQDIESIMSKSYRLYSENKDNPTISKMALDIATDVHEIKKDYYRVINGLESFLNDFEKKEGMKLKYITTIIEENINRYLSFLQKNIKIEFNIKNNISIKRYYPVFTIINNLITNAVDSIEDNGEIKISQSLKEGVLSFSVVDTGSGIEEDDLAYIFNPGYTTKYDVNTGSAYTGIGLAHVKNLLDDLGGNIEVESILGIGSTFKVSIPINNLER